MYLRKKVIFSWWLCSFIWGGTPHGYSFRPSVGASSGLLTICDCFEVEVSSYLSLDHVLLIHGRFVESNDEFFQANDYAPCDGAAKKLLWVGQPCSLVIMWKRSYVFVVISMLFVAWMIGEVWGQHFGCWIVLLFNQFIVDNSLLDLPLGGSRFTWYMGDGQSMSSLKRFLLSKNWCLTWA